MLGYYHQKQAFTRNQTEKRDEDFESDTESL